MGMIEQEILHNAEEYAKKSYGEYDEIGRAHV